jgi:hypothetical protein
VPETRYGSRAAPRALVALGAVAVWFVPAVLHAEEQALESKAAESNSDAPLESEGEKPSPTSDESWGYWGDQTARLHLGTEAYLGAIAGGQAQLAYGKPHFFWAGMTAGALSSPEFVAFSAGPQLNLLLINLALRVRRTESFVRHFPVRTANYRERDLTNSAQPRARYSSLDGALWGVIPAGPTLGLWGALGSVILDYPSGDALFTEYYRYTIQRPQVLLGQLAWWWRLLDDRLLVGPALDVVASPGRDALLRAGGSLFLQLGDNLSFEQWGSLPVKSPDPKLDWITQAWGTARFKWRWASGEPTPGFY